MTRDAKRLTQDEFDRLLATYGGDLDRWPEVRRAGAQALLAESPVATQAMIEARALDAVIARAPTIDPSRLQPLSDRIFAAAMAGAVVSNSEPSSMQRDHAQIILLPTRKSGAAGAGAAPFQGKVELSRPVHESARWRAGMALAASLMLGIMIGISDLAPTSAFGLSASTDALAGDAEVVLSALQGNGLSALDEDEI